jgi:hypothetical protein
VLFVAQRHKGIYAAGSACGDIASRQRHQHQQTHTDQRNRIARLYLEKHAAQQARITASEPATPIASPIAR